MPKWSKSRCSKIRNLPKELADKGYQFSSANSINIGRIVPQVAYYVYAYTKLLANGEIKDGEKINVVVPTGNFGNILAHTMQKNLGVPIAKLICASNDNKYCMISSRQERMIRTARVCS